MSEEIPIGVPEGFYSNSYLKDLNKFQGWLPPSEKDKYPVMLKCWGCDEPLRVCGYPHYICDNNHYYNAETKEKWIWKGYDDVYHSLLTILQGRIEPTYQKLFHATSKKKVRTEANEDSTSLGGIAKRLYDKLNIQEEDPYHWGRDTLRHHAGIRFAINMMSQAIQSRKEIDFTRWSATSEEFAEDGFEAVYSRQAEKLLEEYGEEQIKQMLLSIEETKKTLPKQQVQTFL